MKRAKNAMETREDRGEFIGKQTNQADVRK
jgi:hypothetical protein